MVANIEIANRLRHFVQW